MSLEDCTYTDGEDSLYLCMVMYIQHRDRMYINGFEWADPLFLSWARELPEKYKWYPDTLVGACWNCFSWQASQFYLTEHCQSCKKSRDFHYEFNHIGRLLDINPMQIEYISGKIIRNGHAKSSTSEVKANKLLLSPESPLLSQTFPALETTRESILRLGGKSFT